MNKILQNILFGVFIISLMSLIFSGYEKNLDQKILSYESEITSKINFDAKVSKKRLGLNERLRVDFKMNENGDDFIPPPFTGFQVVSGPQQSESRSWINGVQNFSKTYTYFLTPKLKGKFTLGQAAITIGDEVYKTSPIGIEVTEAVEKPIANVSHYREWNDYEKNLFSGTFEVIFWILSPKS